MENKTWTAMEELLCEMKERVEKGIQKPQMLAILTEKGSNYYVADPLDPNRKDENAILSRVKAEPQVLAVGCMWDDGSLDIPSMYFRQGLLALAPENGEAYVLLQGEGRVLTKKLADTL